MTVRNVKKNLAGQQDLLSGVGPYNQIRRGVAVSVDGPAKSYIELWKSYCGDAYVGTFEDGFTAATGDVAVSLILGKAYRYTGATQVTVAKDSSPGISWSELVVSTDSLLVREALRRSYAEAGYNLVDGSFEVGGELVNANDVLLQERTGKGFTGQAGPVAAGTVPGAGFTDRSGDVVIYLSSYDAIRGYSGGATRIYCTGRNNVFDGAHGWFFLDANNTNGVDDDATLFVDALGRRWRRQMLDEVLPEWWGAKRDGVTDDCIAVQSAIDFAAPFKWKGSVASTKSAMSSNKQKIVRLSNGDYRTTKTILLNPYVTINGAGCGSFFNSRGNSCILGDFADKDKFVVDAASYNSSGVRVLSSYGNASNFDAGNITGVPGITLEDFGIESANGIHRGALNLHAASITKINRISMTRANMGAQISACWSGSMRDCFMLARAVGGAFDYTTIFNVDTNYLSVSGTKPTAAEFTYPAYGNIPADSVVGISAIDGYLELNNNTTEGHEVAIHNKLMGGFNAKNHYFEAIKSYCIATISSKTRVEIMQLNCPLAKILKYDGDGTPAVTLDFKGMKEGFVTYSAFGDITEGDVVLEGWVGSVPNSFAQYIKQAPYLSTAGELELFVNGSTGNDTYNGQSQVRAVRTLDALLPIIQKHARYPIRINIAGTVNNFNNNPDQTLNPLLNAVNITFVGGTINFNDTGTTHLYSLSARDSKFVFNTVTLTSSAASLAGGFRALLSMFGCCSVSFISCAIPAVQPIFGVGRNNSANIQITMNSTDVSSATASLFFESDNAFGGNAVWSEAGNLNTKTNRSVGGRTSDIKLGSNTFP